MAKVISTILFLTILTQGIAANYYVSNSGNDASGDGSIGNPWKTLQFSVNQLMAGDVLNIRGGAYVGKIDMNNSGNTGQPIIIKNHLSEVAIIEGSTLSDYEYLLNISNVDYITISGVKFQDYQKLDAIGIQIINSSNISIFDNEFSNIDYSSTALGQTPNDSQNSQPIIVFGRDPVNPIVNLKINGNTIHDCEVGYSECLSINGNIDGFEVKNNQIYSNTNISIVAIGHEGECSDPQFDQARNGLIKNNLIHDNPSAYAAAGGIYIDGGKDIIVENNTVYNNDYGIEIGCENNGAAPNDPSASEIVVRNNLIYNNGISGIALGGYNYPISGKVETTTLSNNSCFNNDTANSYSGEMLITYVENSIIENNVFYTNNSEKVLYTSSTANPTLSLNYNVFYSPSGVNDIVIEINGTEYNEFSSYQTGESQDANSLFANPLFVSTAIPNPNLHLQSMSPAVDAGNPSFFSVPGEVDMDGANRKVGANVDCGADELATVLAVAYLQKLKAILKNNQVGLSWSTVSEMNSDRFEIEQSPDGHYWKNIGEVVAKNNSNEIALYSVIDRAPLAGTSYYRLKQFDLDGTFSYSNIVSVQLKKTIFSAYPNPTKGVLELILSQEMNAEVIVMDMLGEILIQKNFRSNHMNMNLSTLPNGLYSVAVFAQGEWMNVKVVLQR